MPDLYEILGIPRDADATAVKKAYRGKVKGCHPDTNGGVESQEFLDLKEAYDVLIDPEKRAFYDETGTISRIDPKKILDQVAKSLADNFINLIETVYNWEQMDMKAVMEDILDQVREGMIAGLEKDRAKISRVERFRARLSIVGKSEEDDPEKPTILKHISITIKSLKNQLFQKEQALEAHDQAIKMLDDYEFQADSESWTAPGAPNITFRITSRPGPWGG